MDAPQPRTLSDRMALARRRVVAGALALFVAAWIAVFALGREPASTAAQATSAQASGTVTAGSAGSGTSATGSDDSTGSGYDDESAGDDSSQSRPSTSSDSDGAGATSDAPLVTSQS